MLEIWSILLYANHDALQLERLEKMPSLSCLHISSDIPVPLVPDEITSDLQYLTLLGIGWQMWDVTRIGGVVELSEWPTRKVNLHVVDDFGCEDDEWLFRTE